MLEFLSHNCKEKASFFLIVFFNLLILCQKLLIQRYKKHVRQYEEERKRRYLGRYFAHPMMQNRRAKRDDYKPSAVRVTQRCVP
ncbi:hypothetical protein [Piscirickettsia salmonis]|uniref:hypothetical protein n=1 Tax=Piscirickettsia salmonis TaxID=1238 RepID=UPI0012B82533|nr:hypothetical protein [Piscirickettsia salmonis]QHS31791.1 hypothetical protein GW535_03900 [Piscirickettsia salmonis]QIX54089.1 hypothetical protein GW536_06685 [Piscirickettsia salmonis]